MIGGISAVARLAVDRVSRSILPVLSHRIVLPSVPISFVSHRSPLAFSRRIFTVRMSSTSSRTGLDSMSPAEARRLFRNGGMNGETTSGLCLGYIQANIAILPSELAGDFERFCQMNEAACPVLYCSKPGEVGAPPLAVDSDIRCVGTQFKFKWDISRINYAASQHSKKINSCRAGDISIGSEQHVKDATKILHWSGRSIGGREGGR